MVGIVAPRVLVSQEVGDHLAGPRLRVGERRGGEPTPVRSSPLDRHQQRKCASPTPFGCRFVAHKGDAQGKVLRHAVERHGGQKGERDRSSDVVRCGTSNLLALLGFCSR